MTLEHVNVQELQRLGDAINMTMEAIRRVAPQIAFLQQQASPFGTQVGYGVGAGLGVNPWAQPQPAWVPQFGQQLYPPHPVGQPFGPGFGAPVIVPIPAAYIQGHIQAIRSLVTQQATGVGGGGFGQPTWPAQQFGFAGPQQPAPFVNLPQRPY